MRSRSLADPVAQTVEVLSGGGAGCEEHVRSRFHRRCRSKRCRRRGRPAWGEEVDAPRLTQPVLTNPGLVLSMTSASRHDHRSHGADEASEMRRASHSASRQWCRGPLSGGGVIHCMCTEWKILFLTCGQQRLKRRRLCEKSWLRTCHGGGAG